MNAKVTLGLCVKNGAEIVKTAFESISIQDYPHESLMLIIVDDGSSDNTLSLALEFAQETDIQTFVASNKGQGLAAARQMVVNNAEGEYLLWIDDDLVLLKDYVRMQVEFMKKEPNVGAARGLVRIVPRSTIIAESDSYYHMVPPVSADPKTIGTGGSIYRLKALEDVGGFDIRIKGAGEDIDVSRRIRESGWRLAVNKSAQVYQKHLPTTIKALWRRNYGYGYGNHFLFHKYEDQHFLMQYLPPYVLLVALKMTRTAYRATKMKKVFVFFTIHLLSMIMQSLGFARAHLAGYGHD